MLNSKLGLEFYYIMKEGKSSTLHVLFTCTAAIQIQDVLHNLLMLRRDVDGVLGVRFVVNIFADAAGRLIRATGQGLSIRLWLKPVV